MGDPPQHVESGLECVFEVAPPAAWADGSRVQHAPLQRHQALREAYRRLREAFGHQAWWPARTVFEVCVGAILTQNTSWVNAARALARLDTAGALEPGAMAALAEPDLAELIRASGCHRVKARRLRAFLAILGPEPAKGLATVFLGQLGEVRARLLSVAGVGPETADCMLLYAGGRPSYVVDAYTRRIFTRHGWQPAGADYYAVQTLCADAFAEADPGAQLDLWRDGHAQWVAVAKTYCHARNPLCTECPLAALLPEGGPITFVKASAPVGTRSPRR